MRTYLTTGFAAILVASLVACGGAEKIPPQDPVAATPPAPPPMPVPAATMDPKPVADATPVPPPPAKPLTDMEILGYLRTANSGEVAIGDVAKKQATKGDVKSFASMMVSHHNDANGKEKSVEKKTKMVASETSADGVKLKADADAMVAKLQATAKGNDFDKAYIDGQIAVHKGVLEEIDTKLIPAAQNPDVRDLITASRKTVADHLAKAQEIQGKLK